MIFALPDILHEKENEWEWDGWKPKAKPNASREVKNAIAEWVKEAEKDDDFTDEIEEI